MFTGIVQGIATVTAVTPRADIITLQVEFSQGAINGVVQGASVSLDGCCLTVTAIPTSSSLTFDLVPETIQRSSFKDVAKGSKINFERSLRFGDEVGGHILSGHVDTVAEVSNVQLFDNSRVVTFRCSPEWTKYLFTKGYIALNGASLTLTRVDKTTGEFDISLIPETLAKTTFGAIVIGEVINVEVDRTTQAIVDTVERIIAERGSAA